MSSFQEKYLKYKQKYLELKNYAETNQLLGAGRSQERFKEIIRLQDEPLQLLDSENNLDSVEELQNELDQIVTEEHVIEDQQTGGAEIDFDDFEMQDFEAEEVEEMNDDIEKDLEALFDELDDEFEDFDA